MSTATIDRTVARKGVLAELAGQLKAGNLTQEESAALLAEWDRNNPAPNGNPASASVPAADKPKSTLMKSPDADKARQEILNRLATNKISVQEAQAELARVETANRGRLFCKVSAKGGLSLYGLQRMPVTLYVEQWEKLTAFADQIMAFAKANDKALSRKPAKA